MAGYDGYSMSNNARAAYASGEMPIIKAYDQGRINLNELRKKAKKSKVTELSR